MHDHLARAIYDEIGENVIVTCYMAVIEYVDAEGNPQTYLAVPPEQQGWRTMGLIEYANFVVRRIFARALEG